MFDQGGNRAYLEFVFCCKKQQIRQACHGAVVFHDLADHGSRRTTGHACQVAACFGVACTHQHTTVDRLQGEDMTRLHEVADLRIFGHRRRNRARAVCGRNTRRHALSRFDGYRERRRMLGAIARDHGLKLQQLATLACERETNQPTAIARHEVDALCRHVVSGQHKVALVLAVFFVNQNDDAPGLHVGDDVFNWGNTDGHGSNFINYFAQCLAAYVQRSARSGQFQGSRLNLVLARRARCFARYGVSG